MKQRIDKYYNIGGNVMTIKFETPAETFMAIAIAVRVADGRYSLEEMKEVWLRIRKMDVFKGYSFTDLHSKIFEAFSKDPTVQFPVFSKDEIDSMIAAAKEELSPELRETAFRMAVKLAYVDGLHEKEQVLIDQLQHGLEIDSEIAEKIIKSI